MVFTTKQEFELMIEESVFNAIKKAENKTKEAVLEITNERIVLSKDFIKLMKEILKDGVLTFERTTYIINFLKQKNAINLHKIIEPKNSEPKYIYSIKELAALLNCSIVTAQKFKNEGKIPYRQMGRKLIFEVDEVLAAMHKYKKKGCPR